MVYNWLIFNNSNRRDIRAFRKITGKVDTILGNERRTIKKQSLTITKANNNDTNNKNKNNIDKNNT